jgi:hypothetical protein
MNDAPLRVTLKLYADEDPVLYAMLKSSSHRGRSRTMRSLLRKGLAAVSTASHSAGGLPGPTEHAADITHAPAAIPQPGDGAAGFDHLNLDAMMAGLQPKG